MDAPQNPRRLRVGMAGLGMIFDETYRPVFEQLAPTASTAAISDSLRWN